MSSIKRYKIYGRAFYRLKGSELESCVYYDPTGIKLVPEKYEFYPDMINPKYAVKKSKLPVQLPTTNSEPIQTNETGLYDFDNVEDFNDNEYYENIFQAPNQTNIFQAPIQTNIVPAPIQTNIVPAPIQTNIVQAPIQTNETNLYDFDFDNVEDFNDYENFETIQTDETDFFF